MPPEPSNKPGLKLPAARNTAVKLMAILEKGVFVVVLGCFAAQNNNKNTFF